MTKGYKKRLLTYISSILKKSQQDDIGGHAAGLAYYVIFALVPILVIFVNVLSFILPSKTLSTKTITYLSSLVGTQGTLFLENTLHHVSDIQTNTAISIIALLVILYAASNLFVHLQKSFTVIFQMDEIQGNLVKKTAKKRLVAISYLVILLLLIFFLILGNILSSLFFAKIQSLLGSFAPVFIFIFLQHVTTLLLSVFFFLLFYRFVSIQALPWKSAFLGGLIAALLFGLVNILLSIYLSFSTDISVYGVAGFFIAFLLWFYYSSLSLFFGAEVAQTHRTLHSEI